METKYKLEGNIYGRGAMNCFSCSCVGRISIREKVGYQKCLHLVEGEFPYIFRFCLMDKITTMQAFSWQWMILSSLGVL